MQEIRYDLNLYNYEIVNDIIIIKKKEVELTKEDFLNTDLTYSTIISANMNNDYLPLSYKGIVEKLLVRFSARRLKNISLFKTRIKDGEFYDNGYYYIEELNISYFGLSSNDCKKEIINLIYNLDVNFEIKIKLINGTIIIFKKN
jgi:hypothetical protein